MAVNFLNPNLLPKLIGKPLFTENYEPENLLSDQFIKKTRGFIAFPSVKPPVHLEFEFICNINIHYIFLNTTVGSQKCSGIEVLAKNSKTAAFVSISKAVYSGNGIFFCNKKIFSNISPPPNFNKNYHLAFFKGDTFRQFLNACAIRIVIFRTEKSVPCLADVEVWGYPSRSCSEVTKNTVLKLVKKETLQTPIIENKKHEDNFDLKMGLKIPDDFKDNLTFELMTIPMTLPSGKTVDQSTLEKHIQSEALFGRQPCDPFTGVNFTNSLKPILNVGLKSRIDMFLIENSHRTEFFNLRRIVGKRKETFCGEASCSKNKTIKASSNDDIENAIELAKLDPKFYSFTSEQSEISCILCKNNFVNFYYKIPCDHFYCRSCLLEICKVLRCLVCEANFSKREVEKINK